MPRLSALAPLALLALTAAASPHGSAGSAWGACLPHRNNEVRCAVRLDVPPSGHRYTVRIQGFDISHASATMTTDTYVSMCGAPGRMVSRQVGPVQGVRQIASFTNEPGSITAEMSVGAGLCVETFIYNCTANARPSGCQAVMNLVLSQIEVR
ncbi:hypothetical protein [Sediminicoccus sp. BL-A-41-H5]|jgi:hypothetical protein|uniref:hypothetical protein n=1 Tax=Sediminicoccus sp. BL-A-41-H5 TaxID=3421106 RepID=UPI003D67E9FF